jgi:hypothetical protein
MDSHHQSGTDQGDRADRTDHLDIASQEISATLKRARIEADMANHALDRGNAGRRGTPGHGEPPASRDRKKTRHPPPGCDWTW